VIVLYLPVSAEAAKGDLSVGLNYPGLGVKYSISNKIALEVKGQSAMDITVIGLRGNYFFKPEGDKKLKFFTGLEADFISFKGEVSKGSGIAAEVFAGGEYFVNKKLAIQLDLGPAFISLTDSDYSESVSGIEYVVNFGINYYFKIK